MEDQLRARHETDNLRGPRMLLECRFALLSLYPRRKQFRAWHESASFPMRQGHGGLGPKDGSGSGPYSGLTAKPCRPNSQRGWKIVASSPLASSVHQRQPKKNPLLIDSARNSKLQRGDYLPVKAKRDPNLDNRIFWISSFIATI